MGKTTRTLLLERIEAFRVREGMSESAFGLKVVNDSKLVSNLRRGRATLATIERVEQFLAGGHGEPAEDAA